MKKLLIAAAILTGLYSCSEEFEVAAPYQNYTFAYSLLNKADTAHYVRIQKAFLDENKSALDMAAISDSSFYKNLNVYVLELNATGTSRLDSIVLTRVNMADEGYPKDEGSFFTEPNYAYKFKKALNAGNRYRLVINNPETGISGAAEINIIDNEFDGADQNSIDFSRTVNIQGGAASLTRISSIVPANTKFADGVIRFRYVEEINGTLTDKFVDYYMPYVEANTSTSSIRLEVLNSSIYSFLGTNIGAATAGVKRYLDSCDIIINAGGEDFFNYVQTQQIGGGLTGDLSRPLFTNFSGQNIYGLFSSRATKAKLDIPLAKAVLDSLKSNSVTASLNFVDFSPR